MGVIHSAVDPEFGRELAIKVMIDTRNSHAITQFFEEAQITGQLEHPNIVPVHELGTDATGRPFLAMKLVHGRNLRDVIRESEKRQRPWSLDESEMLAIFRKVAEAMAYAHSRGVIHRDLKPENIMVGEFGEVLVMDWGLAKPLAHPSTRQLHADRATVVTDRRAHAETGDLTLQGDVFGTPSYMAPEQARGDHDKLDHRADIFALGAILYALLTTRAPYGGKNAVHVLAQARDARFVPADRAAPWRGVPKELAAIAAKAMAFEPRWRYQSAHDMLDDVAAYQAFAPIAARRDGPVDACVKWMRRHPRLTLGLSLTGVFGMALAVVVAGLVAQVERADLAERLAAAETARADEQALVAEAQHARAAAETARRAEAEARQRDAEQVALDRAEQLRLLQAGDYEQVLRLLEGQLRGQRDEAIEEFIRLVGTGRAAGKNERQIISEITPQRIDGFLDAFERLFAQHASRQITVTPDDYFFAALLRDVGKNDAVGAIRDLDRAIELNPRFFSAYLNRGCANLVLKRYETAITDFDTAIELNPGFIEAYLNRGVANQSLKRYEAAIADFDAAIALNANLGDAYSNRGVLKALLHDHAGAIADYDRAIELTSPPSAVAYANRGDSKREIGDFGGAMTDFDRAIELNPHFLAAYNGRGRAHAARRNFQAAIRDYDHVILHDAKNSTAFYNRAVAKFAQNDFAGAIRDYDQAIAIQPDYPAAFVNRAIAKSRMSDVPGAFRDFDRAIALDPNRAESFLNRAILKARINDPAGALRDLDRCLELDPNNVMALADRGIAKFELDDPYGALRDLDRALEIAPTRWETWMNRGAVRLNAQIDTAGGIRDVQQAYRLCTDASMRRQIAGYLQSLGAAIPD